MKREAIPMKIESQFLDPSPSMLGYFVCNFLEETNEIIICHISVREKRYKFVF